MDEPGECHDVEARIVQHFTRLHGVLQNMQAKLIEQLYHPRTSLNSNLREIEMQLCKQEKQLGVALKLANYTNENFDRVDIRNAIKVLKEMADLPCHLVCSNCTQDESISFIYSEDALIKFLEDNHALRVPQMAHYELLRTEMLPENYEIDPLVEDPSIANLLNQTLSSKTVKSPLSNMSVASDESTVVKKVANPEETPEEDNINHRVEIARINSPSSFFVRYVSSKAKFAQLEKDMREYAETCDEKLPVELQKNDICIVQQTENNWYRGRVMYVKCFGKIYNIFYIDYGYKECDVSSSRIRSIIDDKHLDLQPQAIRCSLHGIIPIKNTWTSKSIEDFTKLLQETSVFMHVIQRGVSTYYVDICTISSEGNSMGPQSICNAMVFMKHACDTSINKTRQSNNTNVYTKEELLLYKKTSVTIGHIKSPAEIYVLKKGQWSDILLKLSNDLKEYYENNALTHVISNPEKGLPCATHTDDLWHRCEIVNVISEDKVEVFFVDKGCTLTLDCNMLRSIPHKYTLFKAQAINISLRYVSPDSDGTWKAESIDILSSIISSKKTVTVNAIQKTQDGYSCCMSLRDIPDVSRLLKSKGVVKTWKNNKPSKKIATDKCDIDTRESFGNSSKELLLEESDSDVTSVEEEETIKDPFKMEVYIKRVVAPNCIYVAQKDREISNSNLIDAMQDFYNNYCSEPRDNWSENALCAVYSAKDKAYFRAEIVKIKSPTEVSVYFCDIGIVETVTIKDIQVLHQQFTKQPAYCFKVKLAGILPCGGSSAWPSLSISTLTDIIRENSRCKFFITKLDQQDSCDNVIPVELWVRQMKVPGPLEPVKIEINCINKMLVDEGVVLPIKDYFTKTIAVLTTEFKQFLNNQVILCDDENVQWFSKETCRKIDCEIDDSSSCKNECLSQISNVDTSKEKRDHPKRATDWLPLDEIEEEVFIAVPTNVDDKGAVYLHPLKSQELFKLIENNLQIYMASKKIKLFTQWKEGDICIAKYHRNNKWYRGKVLQVVPQYNDKAKLNILFIDYGNREECELEEVTRDIIMEHIPIQCTKCIINGLSPETTFGNWTRTDLDRLHMALVEQPVQVCVLQRQPTHLDVSITLLKHRCNLLQYFASIKPGIDMKIKIESKSWNSAIIDEEADSTLNLIKNSTVIEEITDNEIAEISKENSLELETSNIMLEKNMISGSFIVVKKSEDNSDKETIDSGSISDIFIDDNRVICSTPQNISQEGIVLGDYKPLNIPLDTQYIELILCCNINPTTLYAHLAENNDDMFSNVLHDYYVQYKNMMLDIEENVSSQPLIESFEKNTSCITKFTDDKWYRCVITQSQKTSEDQMCVMLYYIDYGNNEYKMLDLSTETHDLHVPKKEWTEVPAMVIECQFWNIDFTSDDVDLLASKLDEIYSKEVVARVKEINENILVAEIYKNKMCQELLYAHLIDEGLYQYNTKED